MGGLSEGTTGGAAEDHCGDEVRGPQSLSGETWEGDWEASRGEATLTLMLWMCENRAHPLLTCQSACHNSTAELGISGFVMGSTKIRSARSTGLPSQVFCAAFFLSLSTFFPITKIICAHFIVPEADTPLLVTAAMWGSSFEVF